jgi:hypothetical protein
MMNCFKFASIFAFKFNLRHYIKGPDVIAEMAGVIKNIEQGKLKIRVRALEAGAYTRPLFSST